MITEELLDKIGQIISGYKKPTHPLRKYSDKEVAKLITGYVSSYINESKQEVLKEAGTASGFPMVLWGDGLTSSKSGRPSKDWANGIINPQLIKDISKAAVQSGVQVTITHSRTGHDKKTSSGYISRHYNGTGIDVAILNGRGSGGATETNPGDQKFKEAGLKLQAALVSMGYKSNVGESGKNKVVLFRTNLGGNHYNHLHISNRIYNGKQWSPSKEDSKDKTPFKNTTEGNKFRQWINDTYPSYAENIDLDPTGEYDNSYIRKAWAKYGKEYQEDMATKDSIEDLKPKKKIVSDPNIDSETEIELTQDLPEVPVVRKSPRPQTIGQLPMLRYGSAGPDVENVQRKLLDLYGPEILPKYGADGNFKSETRTAVKKFQRDHKLAVDGIVGPMTYKTLYKYFPTVVVNKDADSNSDNLADASDDLTEMLHTSTLYRKIFKEEAQRAQRLIFEYNEEKTWQSMTAAQKEQALLSADDDMGPDFADEFADTPWLEIPDVITNRIDLRPYEKSEREQLSRQDFLSKNQDIRGMTNQSKENDAYRRFIEAYLKKQNIQIDYSQHRPLYKALNQLTKDQVRDLFFKAHDFRASMSKFVPPTPEEEEESARNMATIINQDRIDNPGFSRE